MKRAARASLAIIVLMVCGCAAFMPNAADAISPARFDDLWLGVLADVESWWTWVGLMFGV